MCNKAVSCSMFRNVPMSTKKNGKRKKRNRRQPHGSELLSPQERKGKERKARKNTMAPRKNQPQRTPRRKNPKGPTTQTSPIPTHTNKAPAAEKRNGTSSPLAPKPPKLCPQRPQSPPPPPVGWKSHAPAEGTWPGRACRHEVGSPSSSLIAHG